MELVCSFDMTKSKIISAQLMKQYEKKNKKKKLIGNLMQHFG